CQTPWPRVTFSQIWLLLFVACLSAKAQVDDVARLTGTPRTLYPLSGVDSVDTASGDLKIRIPLLHLRGRGLDTDLTFTYDSKIWNTIVTPPDQNNYTDVIPDFDPALSYLPTSNGTRSAPGWNLGIARMA